MWEFRGDPSRVFGLVSTDDRIRRRTLARHRSQIAAASEANDRVNQIWARAGTVAPTAPRLAAELDRARAAHRHHLGQTIFGLLDGLWHPNPAVRERHAPFVLLYLTWERRHPVDWRAAESNFGSAWGRKEAILRNLAGGIPAAIRPQVADLLAEVVRQPYRCKDWRYAELVRHVQLDERLRTSTDPLVRLRAEFLRHVADHPDLRVKRGTWGRWQSPITTTAAASPGSAPPTGS